MFGKDRTKLPSSKLTIISCQNRLQAAKAAIDNRLHDLQRDYGGTPAERQAITDALGGLNVLRRELQIRSYKTGSSNAERMQ